MGRQRKKQCQIKEEKDKQRTARQWAQSPGEKAAEGSGAKHRAASQSESGPKEADGRRDVCLGACEVTLLSAGGEHEQCGAGLGTSPARFAKVVLLQRSSEKGREEGLFRRWEEVTSPLPRCLLTAHTWVRFCAVTCTGHFLSGSVFLLSTNAPNTSLLVPRGTELQPEGM